MESLNNYPFKIIELIPSIKTIRVLWAIGVNKTYRVCRIHKILMYRNVLNTGIICNHLLVKEPIRLYYVGRKSCMQPSCNIHYKICNSKTNQSRIPDNSYKSCKRGCNKSDETALRHVFGILIKLLTSNIEKSEQFCIGVGMRFLFLKNSIKKYVTQNGNSGIYQKHSPEMSNFWRKNTYKTCEYGRPKGISSVKRVTFWRGLLLCSHTLSLCVYKIIPYFTISNKYCSKGYCAKVIASFAHQIMRFSAFLTTEIISWHPFIKKPIGLYNIMRKSCMQPNTGGDYKISNSKAYQANFPKSCCHSNERGDGKSNQTNLRHMFGVCIKPFSFNFESFYHFSASKGLRFFFIKILIEKSVTQDRNKGVGQNYTINRNKRYTKAQQANQYSCYKSMLPEKKDIWNGLILLFSSHDLSLYLYKSCYFLTVLDKHFSHILFLDSTHILGLNTHE